MIDRVLIDTLNLRARDFATRWKDSVRKNPQLKHYNMMEDEVLIDTGKEFYPLLARALDRGVDRSKVGEFFSMIGKHRMQAGFPISEVIYAINLSQKIVIEYLMTEFAPENPMRMYQSIGVLKRVSEFCLLGSFYLTRGFLEETYQHMSNKEKIPEDLLKKYFKDDFFFKGD
jgi:hypothetical protein